MNLNYRLRTIVNEIHSNRLADVGCDHGKVSVTALIENRAKYVIACDISKPSLEKAEKLANKMNITNIDFRCGDGLNVIKDNEIDSVIIAGMGGYEIIKILSNKPLGIENYVLCAHNNVPKLRQFLVENNISIAKDYVIFCDDHFYNIIVANNGKCTLTEKELLLGKDSFENEFYVDYLLYLQDKNQKILDRSIDDNRRNEVNKDMSIIKEELNESQKNR